MRRSSSGRRGERRIACGFEGAGDGWAETLVMEM